MNFHDTTPNPYYDFGPNHYRNDPFYHFEYLTQEIRVVPGPQSDLFTSRGIDTFYKERYQVSAQTDRMGLPPRWPANRIEPRFRHHFRRHCARLNPDSRAGTPIVMLADRQTTGGYAKIATVASVDIPLLVQRATKQYVQFKPVSVIEAQRLARGRTRLLPQRARQRTGQAHAGNALHRAERPRGRAHHAAGGISGGRNGARPEKRAARTNRCDTRDMRL